MRNPCPMPRADADEPILMPQIVAHRGSSATAAEHTLAAYQQAIDEGADALECDVRLTADGHLVCVHDSRIDRTSDGRGRVSNKTLTQLRGHDFGAQEAEDGESDVGLDLGDSPFYDEEARGILTLDRLLELVSGAGRPLDVAIETKHPTRYGGFTEQMVVAALQRFGLHEFEAGGRSRVRVMSFAAIAMRRMRELAPQIPTVYLIDRAPLLSRPGYLPQGSGIAGPSVDVIRRAPTLVADWHSAGHEVHVWTVDTEADARWCLEVGVDAVITNRPGDVRHWLSGRPTGGSG